MSLKKKIVLSFAISAAVIAVLAAFEYINFIAIKKEIRYLELTDTIRSKSLQLRRHEKNFFLYGHTEGAGESAAIRRYLAELNFLLAGNAAKDKSGELLFLQQLVRGYAQKFDGIETLMRDLSDRFDHLRIPGTPYAKFLPYMQSTFSNAPAQTAKLLQGVFQAPPGSSLVKGLLLLNTEINNLRKDGEDILTLSKELDSTARANVDRGIYLSQIAILVLFPLFLVLGIGSLFFISGNVVNRLRLLINVVEKTGKGDFPRMSVLSRWGNRDEVGLLIQKFNTMEDELAQHEEELERKNNELLRTKKLAAIGTLAAGVAHELNNPLNNIALSAQMLVRETGDECPEYVVGIVRDIVGQTGRVKRIVGDLLEFARGREPHKREIDLNEIIMGAYKMVSTTVPTDGIIFTLDTDPHGVLLPVDPEQLERVFINLFTNAVDAMSSSGDLSVKVGREGKRAAIRVADTGKGIPADALEKIFEPFYTTKDKGTGLGLAIVFSIIKKHAGAIQVESGEGSGTVFSITLPLQEESHGS
jgi:signal transduction histidine kinase